MPVLSPPAPPPASWLGELRNRLPIPSRSKMPVLERRRVCALAPVVDLSVRCRKHSSVAVLDSQYARTSLFSSFCSMAPCIVWMMRSKSCVRSLSNARQWSSERKITTAAAGRPSANPMSSVMHRSRRSCSACWCSWLRRAFFASSSACCRSRSSALLVSETLLSPASGTLVTGRSGVAPPLPPAPPAAAGLSLPPSGVAMRLTSSSLRRPLARSAKCAARSVSASFSRSSSRTRSRKVSFSRSSTSLDSSSSRARASALSLASPVSASSAMSFSTCACESPATFSSLVVRVSMVCSASACTSASRASVASTSARAAAAWATTSAALARCSASATACAFCSSTASRISSSSRACRSSSSRLRSSSSAMRRFSASALARSSSTFFSSSLFALSSAPVSRCSCLSRRNSRRACLARHAD
mmetsp:Transcript_6823/g.22644  ORF Transcript_6823/g.22644 Transcript_6823/m.22644 type:complete len:417 (-) Transcript_6823:2716-3966(-)